MQQKLEEEKYYIPSKDEFYVGFIYEWNNNQEDDIWRESIADSESSYHASNHLGQLEYGNIISTTDYKVKYLSKECIESLGWINQEFSFFEEHYCFTLNEPHADNECFLYKGFTSKNNKHLKITNRFGNKVYFEGIIKNKSELSKLMKQLGING